MSEQPQLVLATRNPGKVMELRPMLAGAGVEVIGLDAFPDVPEVEEDGATFEENALKKAREYARATGRLVLADDSGLEVDALGGAPGVRSARYAPTTEERNARVLAELAGVPHARRTARFVSVAVLACPDGPERVFRGVLEGWIADAPRGTGGFGYDPLFLLPDGRTLAELSLDEKNRISHRARALALVQTALPDFLSRAPRR